MTEDISGLEMRLVWIDLEMTGLDTANDSIIEIATVVTDADLNVLAEGPVIAISHDKEILDAMDDWNQKTHSQTGLIKRVLESQYNHHNAEEETLAFLEQHIETGISPMCGNSICQDRRFLARQMPHLEAFFHYRNLDVSTLKELARRWQPQLLVQHFKESTHQALDDIYDSINELKFYREHFFKH